MEKTKKSLPEYLSFTKKERIAILFVVLMLIVYPLIPVVYQLLNKPDKTDHKAFENEIAGLTVKEDSSSVYVKRDNDMDYQHYLPEGAYDKKRVKAELFNFDPNTLPVEGWIRLGVRPKTANTIRNYLAKGGRFYKPEDIGKIWGLHEDEVKRLLPYVTIQPNTTKPYQQYPGIDQNKTPVKQRFENTPVDINAADTSAFIALPGIGSKLAARIISFREKLGGFYKVEQVAETYGLPDSTFQKIKSKLVINGSNVKKLNINTATLDELKAHPYLRYNIANAIVQYRSRHGNFSSVTDIKKIMMITDEVYSRAVNYLSIK